MKNHFHITTAKVVLAIATLSPAFAHGGFEHIRGTVAKVANNVLTVKTAKGKVDVKLDSRTEFTHNDRKAQVSDLKPGARVIAEVPEGSRDHVAHSVRIGDVPAIPSHR
jgi:hypothetical protein